MDDSKDNTDEYGLQNAIDSTPSRYMRSAYEFSKQVSGYEESPIKTMVNRQEAMDSAESYHKKMKKNNSGIHYEDLITHIRASSSQSTYKSSQATSATENLVSRNKTTSLKESCLPLNKAEKSPILRHASSNFHISYHAAQTEKKKQLEVSSASVSSYKKKKVSKKKIKRKKTSSPNKYIKPSTNEYQNKKISYNNYRQEGYAARHSTISKSRLSKNTSPQNSSRKCTPQKRLNFESGLTPSRYTDRINRLTRSGKSS